MVKYNSISLSPTTNISPIEEEQQQQQQQTGSSNKTSPSPSARIGKSPSPVALEFTLSQAIENLSAISKKRKTRPLELDFPLSPLSKRPCPGTTTDIRPILPNPKRKKPPPHLRKIKTKPAAAFGIKEDETATKAANPTPEQIQSDKEYAYFDDEAEFSLCTTELRQAVQHEIQKEGFKYGMQVARWLKPLAQQLDAITPFTGRGLGGRVEHWMLEQQTWRDHGPTLSKERRQQYHYDEVPWFPSESIEALANIVVEVELGGVDAQEAGLEFYYEYGAKYSGTGLSILAGYIIGRGAGMDVQFHRTSNDVMEGNRDRLFYDRQLLAWGRITDFHLGICFSDLGYEALANNDSWRNRMRSRIERRGVVRFELLEHWWGGRYPACLEMRTFGQERYDYDHRNTSFEDPQAEEMFDAGVDQMQEYDL